MAHWIECDWCAGDGLITCEFCAGTGSSLWDEDEILEGVDNEALACDNCEGRKVLDCDPCEGTGGWYAE